MKKFRNALMLRAEVPRDKERITFNSLVENDDQWTHIFCALCEELDIQFGEIWHYGAKRDNDIQYTDRVKERWIPDMRKEDISHFDLIWARGGLPPYPEVIIRAHKDTYCIYYGAGKRFYPIPEKAYDLVLVDSKDQKIVIKTQRPNQRISTFIKPAADNIFRPVDIEKKYDVCISFQLASYTKRFDLALDAIMKGGFSALVIGDVPKIIEKAFIKDYKKIDFAGRHFRKYLPELYSQCRVGLATHSQLESCPRVIPEYLACNLPIIVTGDTLFWKEKYIHASTGVLTKPEAGIIAEQIKWVLDNISTYDPRKYYLEHLSVKKAAKHLADIINKNEE